MDLDHVKCGARSQLDPDATAINHAALTDHYRAGLLVVLDGFGVYRDVHGVAHDHTSLVHFVVP